MRASATAADIIFPLGGLKKSAQDPILYSREALKQDLFRVRTSWEYCQANRDGDAMRYLNAEGQIARKASPWMLSRLADAEREVRDDMEGLP